MMPNPCTLCPAPCCKDYTVTVTSFDILRISQRADLEPREFAEFKECTIFNKDPETVFRFSDGDFPEGYILIIKSHPCFFMDIKNKCMIHGYAPLSCRRYPFDIAGNMNARFCPWYSKILFRHRGPEIGLEPYLKEIKAYRGIVAKWNRNPGKKADCMVFLLDESRRADF